MATNPGSILYAQPLSDDPAQLLPGSPPAPESVTAPAPWADQNLLQAMRADDPDLLRLLYLYLGLRRRGFSRTRPAYGFQVSTAPRLVLDYNPLRKRVVIRNNSGSTVYYGGDERVQSGVGQKAGMPILNNEVWTFEDDEAPPPLWLVAGADALDIRVAETYVDFPSDLAKFFPAEAASTVGG